MIKFLKNTVFTLFTSLFIFANCNGDDPIHYPLVDSWVNIHVDEQNTDVSEILTLNEDKGFIIEVTKNFTDNSSDHETFKGTYTNIDNVLTLTVTDAKLNNESEPLPEGPIVAPYVLNMNSLTVNFPETAGGTITYTRAE